MNHNEKSNYENGKRLQHYIQRRFSNLQRPYFTSFVQALQFKTITKAHSCKYEMYRREEVRDQNQSDTRMFKAASTSDFETWQDKWRFNQEECWTQSIAKTQAD